MGHRTKLNQDDNISMEVSPKLHLLFSVILTNKSLPGGLSYGKNLNQIQNKVDQFLCVIHSISKIDFYSIDFYLQFDSEYINVKHAVYSRIYKLFPTAVIHNNRLETFQTWKDAFSRISNKVDFILLKTNHDHAFVHESYEDFAYFLEDLQSLGPRSLGAISHWPEMIGQHGLRPVPSNRPNLVNFLQVTNWTIGTCLVSRELFKEWWQHDFTDGDRVTRPDNPFGASVNFDSTPMLIPPREFFRHLDGYGHVNVKSRLAAPVRPCCQIDKGELFHNEWKRGKYYFAFSKFDLSIMPSCKDERVLPFLNLALLASAHTLNIRNLFQILRHKNGGPSHMKHLILLFVFINIDFLKKMPKGLFRYLKLDWKKKCY